MLIDNRAHPDYQEDRTGYFESATVGYTPQTFGVAFAMDSHAIRAAVPAQRRHGSRLVVPTPFGTP